MNESSARVHHTAAEGFGAKADTYVAGRPDYPAAIDAWLRETLKLGAGSVAADVGSGTGKFLPRLLCTGARIIAIEPMVAMRSQLTALFPQIEALDGTAEQLPLADASMDAVLCAQAFHWFATHDALQEIRRVLKPGGSLGLVWNVRDESVEWVAALTRILTPYEGDAPRYHNGEWRKVFPAEGFSELQETSFAHAHVGPAQNVIVDRTMSVSFIAALPEEQQQRVLAEIRDLIAKTPQLTAAGAVTMPYRTRAFCCCKVA